ncbi:MAG TPA: hypothetical protein VMS17_08410, partial [Gemmataceae bacterium]|nr:hypothetical protein [Gemmataceae bacterium]
MSRRSFCVALGLVVLLLGGAGVLVYLVVGYEPDLYAKAVAPSPEVRAQRSQEFLTEFFALYNDAGHADQNWGVQFTDEQINSYMEEGFIKQHIAHLPDHVSRPHIVFEP